MSLIFALLTLMALSLAALALVRSVDTGALVLGNLGFKQETTAIGDQATREAIKWVNQAAALTDDLGNSGYYATSGDTVDVTGQQSTSVTRALIDWDGDSCEYAKGTAFGSCSIVPSGEITINGSTKAKYVIFRLCQSAGDANSGTNSCARPMSSDDGKAPKKGKLDYSDYERFSNVSGIYYRVVVRVVGARNTTSFIETIVHR